jgi:hypothetical protein
VLARAVATEQNGKMIALAFRMQAVMTKILPGVEIESCRIGNCRETAAYHFLKFRDDGSEEESFFCTAHGEEYAMRGHITISENI